MSNHASLTTPFDFLFYPGRPEEQEAGTEDHSLRNGRETLHKNGVNEELQRRRWWSYLHFHPLPF